MTGPPRLLLDTNILIHLVRRNRIGETIQSRFEVTNRPERPLVSIVTVGEVLALSKGLGWGPSKVRALEDLLLQLAISDIRSEPVLRSYAEVDYFLRRKGTPIGQNDMWIAATAIVSGAHLLTTDKDFDPLCPTFLERIWINPQQPEA